MSKKQKIKNQNGSICVYLTESRRKSVGTLVAVHGGPGGDHRGNEGIFDEIAMYCGDLGYNLAQFDMYGAGGSDGKPADITLKTQLRDYNSVVDYAAAKLRGPVHVVGESMGATIAALNWRADIASFVLLWPAFDLKDTDLRPYFDIKWKQVLDHTLMTTALSWVVSFLTRSSKPIFRIVSDCPRHRVCLYTAKWTPQCPFSRACVLLIRPLANLYFLHILLVTTAWCGRRSVNSRDAR